MIKILTDDRRSAAEHIFAAKALGEIGVGAKDAIPSLIRMLHDPQYGKSQRAVLVESLGRINAPVVSRLSWLSWRLWFPTPSPRR